MTTLTQSQQFDLLVAKNDFLILDTETTGIKAPAQILEVCVVGPAGDVIYESLVNPRIPITSDAMRVHGITPDMCYGHPDWAEVKKALVEVIANHHVIVYNAKFDRHMMHCSDEVCNLGKYDYHHNTNWWCAMERYAEYHGEWDAWHENYKWQKLTNAISQMGIYQREAHRALGDCLMTLDLIRAMADNPRS